MGVKVYDKATQKEVEVDAAQLQDDINSGEGRFTPTKGKIRVTREGNRTGTVAAENLTDAIAEGWQIADEDDYQHRKMLREEATLAGEAAGLVESAAAGATLGLSTAALEALGMDPRRMAARRQATGGLGTAAELAGALVPAALSGGGSLAGRGLASTVLRSTPAGLASRGAARLEGALATRLGSGAASRILPAGARNFVEGAAQGAGAQLDENVLGDRELNADLLNSATMGGLFGAGAGYAIPGLAKVATGALRAPVKGMQGVLGRMNSATGGMASREAAEIAVREGQEALSGGAQAWMKTATLHGAPDDLAMRLARKGDTSPGREHIMRVERDMPKIQEKAARLFSEEIPAVHAGMDEARRLAGGASKSRYWERQMPKSAEAQRAASSATDDLFLAQRGRIEQLAADNIDPRFPGAYKHSPGVLREGDMALTKMERELVEAEQLSGTARATKKAMAVDAYKRELGEIIDNNGGWGKMRNATPEVRAANIELRKMYGEAKDHLQRADLWGEAAGTQTKLNALYRESAEADDLVREATVGTGLGSITNPDGSFNMGRALKLARAHGKLGGDVAVTQIVRAMEARVAYMDELAKHIDADDAFAAAHAKAKSGVTKIKGELDSLADDAALADDLNELRALQGNKSPSHTLLTTQGPALLGALGLGFGGPMGLAAGVAMGALTQPHRTLLNYASIRNALDKADVKLNGAISGMFEKAKKLEIPDIELPKVPTGVVGRAGKSDADRQSRRETAIAKAVEFGQSPEAIERALAVPHYDLHQVAPGLAGVMQQRVQGAAAFLQSKAPKVYSRPNSKTKLVDPVSAASFERYLEAVVDPIGALSRFQSGRITAETAEAIKVCYPALYADVQRRIQDHLASEAAEGREVPYDTRIRLGTTFSTPTDPSLQPPVASEIQLAIGANYDEPTAQEAMGGMQQPSGHAGKFDNPDRTSRSLQTGSERAASWRTTA